MSENYPTNMWYLKQYGLSRIDCLYTESRRYIVAITSWCKAQVYILRSCVCSIQYVKQNSSLLLPQTQKKKKKEIHFVQELFHLWRSDRIFGSVQNSFSIGKHRNSMSVQQSHVLIQKTNKQNNNKGNEVRRKINGNLI